MATEKPQNPYFRYESHVVARRLAWFSVSVAAYIGVLLVLSTRLQSTLGLMCAAGVYWIAPWILWSRLATVSSLLTPKVFRIPSRLGGDRFVADIPTSRNAALWSGLGIAVVAFAISLAADVPIGSTGMNTWQSSRILWVAAVGIPIYLILATAASRVTVEGNTVKHELRVGLRTSVTVMNEVAAIEVEPRGGANVSCRSVTAETLAPWRSARPAKPQRHIHLPLAVFNSSGAPTIEEVSAATGVEITISE